MIDEGFGILGEMVAAALGDGMLTSFIVDGIIGGVGGVLVFLPQIILLFLIISFLEDSGYLARAAFVMDKVMHSLVGLHGKAFIPMILGFGCGIPGIMATRTMENEKDRLITMLIVPFMSCTARMPVYLLLVGAFFAAADQTNVIFSLYVLGIVVAIIVAFILRKTLFDDMDAPFVMELPDYKLPTLRGILMHTAEKSWGFVRKAGTIILAAAIIVWILSSFPAGVEYGSQESAIGMIGTAVAPVFAPGGSGNSGGNAWNLYSVNRLRIHGIRTVIHPLFRGARYYQTGNRRLEMAFNNVSYYFDNRLCGLIHCLHGRSGTRFRII